VVDCPPGLPAVLADPDQLRIVFGNLIRNAREAMPEGGELTVTAQAVGDGVDVAVADTGVGIPPENLNRVMEPLYSTKARGLGLGLAIARTILDKNHGSLRVASEPGKGTTFTVRLLRAPSVSTGHLAPGRNRTMKPSTPSILVVDDDVDTCQNLSDILTDPGLPGGHGPRRSGRPGPVRANAYDVGWITRCRGWMG
jgi:hypothetical protein